ncbi:MAG: metalloregulator ArsR/SmtB family transcription factor [Proteobacteria bacterium]|nr:metalloregulator ArsR/SmtB family transcription factor [Pseudomonadota bacterium]
MTSINSKAEIYKYTALVGKALSSPSRLELLDLLCQGEKSVEALANQAGLNVKITSAHLKVMKAARIVETHRDGRFIYYRIVDKTVAAFWAKFRDLAQRRFLEIQQLVKLLNLDSSSLQPYDRKSLLKQARKGDVIVIDVRPIEEYSAGHLPYARSIPLSELKKKLSTLDPTKEVVAYCRGPYCVLSHEAVELLKKNGFRASRMSDGVSDWLAAGLPVEQSEGVLS